MGDTADPCPPGPGDVCLWYADVQAAAGRLPAGLLDDEELARAGKYRFAADADRFVVAQCMLRTVLLACSGRAPRDIAFDRGPAGKPRLRGSLPKACASTCHTPATW
jgi:4'-phosphopantetheinyl transferase